MSILQGGAQLNIVSGFRQFARAQPTAVAVIDGERSLTYAALDERTNRLASGLLARGLRPGALVAVLLSNCAEYLESAVAIAKAGMTLVPLSPRGTAEDSRYILEHSQSRGLIFDAELSSRLPPSLDSMEAIVCVAGDEAGEPYEALIESSPAVDPGITADELSAFCIAYTSGTTGKPKGVILGHRARTLLCYASAAEFRLGLGRRSVAVAPLYHGAGFAFAYAPIMTGGTVSILRSWDPQHFLDVVARDGAQSAFLVPTHAATMRAMHEDALRRARTETVDTLFFNAAALPVPLKTWVMESLPGVGIHECYGSTEAATVTNLRPPDALRKAGSVGPAWFATEVRLVDDEGVPVPPGEPGELFSRSPFLMTGYLHDPQATEACTTADGFLTAGDVAVADEEGYYRIVDRKKDLIITGGMNVYPREVENVLVEHPAVREVAVVGMPDDTWGESVTAFVVLNPNVAPTGSEELAAFSRDRLAGYKAPRAFRFVDVLPRNPSGKILKTELRARGG